MKEFYTQKETMEILKVGRKALATLVKNGRIIKVGRNYTRASIEALLGHPIEETIVESTDQPTGLKRKQGRLAELKLDEELEGWEGRAREAHEIIGKAEEKATEKAEEIMKKAEEIMKKAEQRLLEAKRFERALVSREDKVIFAEEKIEGQLKLLAERAKAVKEGEASLATRESQFKSQGDRRAQSDFEVEQGSIALMRYSQLPEEIKKKYFPVSTHGVLLPDDKVPEPKPVKKESLLPDNWVEWTWKAGLIIAIIVGIWLILS